MRYVCQMNVRTLRISSLGVLLVIVLAACGKDLQPSPAVTPTATRETTSPVGLTAGDLAGRIAAGWRGIDRYRAVTTSVSPGTPGAQDSGNSVVEEVILPDKRRQVVTAGGVVQSEIVATGGSIYGRGPDLPGISQPNRDPDVWIVINGNLLGADNAYSGFYQSLLLPSQPPYAGLDPDKRSRPAEELGAVTVDGRTCQQYQMVDTTLTGERIEVTIALAENGLVCSIVTESAASTTTTVYAYDQPAAIEAPASPVPAPAENG